MDSRNELLSVQPDQSFGTRRLSDRLRALRMRELGLLPVLGLVVVVGSLTSSVFLTSANIINILQQSSVLAVVVIGESLILIVGKFDLSLESTVGLAPMIGAWLVASAGIGGAGTHINPYLAILVVLAVGAGVGAVNALLVVRFRLNAFIVTLAMLILLRGVTEGVSKSQTLFNLPGPFIYIGSANWLGVPVSVWLAGALYVVVGYFLHYHRLGRAIYAIGGNAEAARAAGIRVERVTAGVFIFGGILAAVGGLISTGIIASATAAQGQNLIFSVFAAAVIGGVSMSGGRGHLLGALAGVLLLGTVTDILTLSQISPFWIDASNGAIILIALMLTKIASREEGI